MYSVEERCLLSREPESASVQRAGRARAREGRRRGEARVNRGSRKRSININRAFGSHDTHADARAASRSPFVIVASLRGAGNLQRLREVGADVVDVLDADRDADHVLRHAGGFLLSLAKLLVRGGRGVDHQRLGVAHVGELRRELDGVDELRAWSEPALDADVSTAPYELARKYSFARR